jgi:hypothetical protein
VAQHDHRLDSGTVGKRLVCGGFQLHDLARAVTAVGGDQHARPGVGDAVAQRQRRESAEDHRMHGADARARMHRDDRLGHERQVDDDPIAGRDAQRPQRIGEAAHLGMQLAVAELADGAVLGLEDQRGVRSALREVHVETVVRDVELAVGKPAVIRRGGLVEHLGERLAPVQRLARLVGPEAFEVRVSASVQVPQLRGVRMRDGGEIARRGERALLQHDRADVLPRGALALLHGRYGRPRCSVGGSAACAPAMILWTNSSFASAGADSTKG